MDFFTWYLIWCMFMVGVSFAFLIGYLTGLLKGTKKRNENNKTPIRKDKEVSPNTYNAKP